MGPVLFNSNDIEALVAGLAVVSIPIFVPAKKTVTSYPLALQNKVKVVQSFFTGRILPVTCTITRPSRQALDQAFDALWPLISGTELPLTFVEGAGQRQYTATWADFNLIEQAGGYAKFDLLFTASDQYGYDPTYVTLLQQNGVTAQPLTWTMGDVDGSAEWQVPIITLTLTAVTGGSSVTLSIGNPASGQTCNITRSWAANDVLEIDSRLKTVKVNGTLVDSSGAIPEWNPKSIVGTGQSKILVSDGLTTRTYNLNVKLYRRWA
jgi:hypothetical protein